MPIENELLARADQLISDFEETYMPKSKEDDLGSDARAWLLDYESQSQINIHDLLQSRQQVAVIWSIEDVQGRRSDLNDLQCWKVLQECRHCHDCEQGFTWDLIDEVAERLFSSP